ncbi:hypothetical protein P175DRAFT_0303077 [Aspergillus ochraceoroseus IBT 24754]|uniref:Uncharacterized protein n=1 Tax=Aspergillus ochraceoroseus IBT 24754 TaxID=1392256 RepID=A0A2T5LT86_9EURO|nr:uncharacterized protein P175DRAFT_0303077 [Aspergillus ochraceoroseus IBT 24754]PTU19481.1 hypothetical protein P175DRAFT_0303077 [Aspergillus ochraceoroseus IBT 24754]
MSDSRLMDIEPGGEQTQYESVRIFTETPAKQHGQLDGDLPHTISEMRTTWQTDYSEKKTRELREVAEEEREVDPQDDAAKTRREQGYGPGSGVGA